MRTIYSYKTKKGNNVETFDTKGYVSLRRDGEHVYEHQFSTAGVKIQEFNFLAACARNNVKPKVTKIDDDQLKRDLANCKNYTNAELQKLSYGKIIKESETVGAVVHPKCYGLYELIRRIQIDGEFRYYTDVESDWWDYAEEAIMAANETLDDHFKGTYYTPDPEAGYKGLF